MPVKKQRSTLTFACEGSLIRAANDIVRLNYLKHEFKLIPGRYAKRQYATGEPVTVDVEDPEQQPAQANGNQKYTPDPAELVRVPFRLLSATIVAGETWRATDFSKPGVLEGAVDMFIGVPAFTDHWQATDNSIGVVETAKFTRVKNNIPAGVDGVYLIDGKMNERLARNLLMPMPSIHSNSVTIEFEWEPSHEFENEDDFERNVGQIIDGKMVTRVAVKILAVYESSILWLGADPYAKMLDPDGKPMHVDTGSTYDEATKYAKELWSKEKKYYISFSFSKKGIYLSAETPKAKVMNELEKFIRTLLGLKDDEPIVLLKPEDKEKLSKFPELNTRITNLAAELEIAKKDGGAASLKAELEKEKTDGAALKVKVGELEPFAKTGKQVIETKRAETERLYKLKAGDKPDAVLLDMIKKATNEQLDALLAQYAGGVTEKFEATCKSCGKHDFEFRSTLAPPKEGATAEKESEDAFLKNFM